MLIRYLSASRIVERAMSERIDASAVAWLSVGGISICASLFSLALLASNGARRPQHCARLERPADG